MPRPCAVEPHARGYKIRQRVFADATALCRGDSRSLQVLLTSSPPLPRRRSVRRHLGLLHKLVVPRQVSLVSIANVAWTRNAVKLIRINYQLRVDAQAAQSLIHLLATLDR